VAVMFAILIRRLCIGFSSAVKLSISAYDALAGAPSCPRIIPRRLIQPGTLEYQRPPPLR
jgi:hypothetical protein